MGNRSCSSLWLALHDDRSDRNGQRVQWAFGNLRKTTAQKFGLNPVLMASANSAGGVMGKMIAAQSLVIVTTATGQTGKEAAQFRSFSTPVF